MVIRYRGTSPKLGTSQGECPYPCTQVSFFGDDGGDEVVGLSLSFRLRTQFSSCNLLISCSSSTIFSHNTFLFSYRRRKGINWILDLFTVFGRLDFLNSTCISPGWGKEASSSSELASPIPFMLTSRSSSVDHP